MRADGWRGAQAHKYPLDPVLMARACRTLARDLRAEHAAGEPPVVMMGNSKFRTITRWEAAVRLDQQAERWEAEVRTGEPNTFDREKIGCG
jgi:hypothetical protein